MVSDNNAGKQTKHLGRPAGVQGSAEPCTPASEGGK